MTAQLRLEVIAVAGGPPGEPVSLVLDGGACTLGRSPENDLPLSDPERLVSGLHARIELLEDGPWIFDLSTNGTYLNGSPDRLARNTPVALHDGDRLAIGPYEIAVAVLTPGAAAPNDREDLPRPSSGGAGGEPDLDGIGIAGATPDILELLGEGPTEPTTPKPAADPFPDAQPLDRSLEGPAQWDLSPRAAERRPTPVEHVHFRAPESQPIPEDYDPLRDMAAPAPSGAAPTPSGQASPAGLRWEPDWEPDWQPEGGPAGQPGPTTAEPRAPAASEPAGAAADAAARGLAPEPPAGAAAEPAFAGARPNPDDLFAQWDRAGPDTPGQSDAVRREASAPAAAPVQPPPPRLESADSLPAGPTDGGQPRPRSPRRSPPDAEAGRPTDPRAASAPAPATVPPDAPTSAPSPARDDALLAAFLAGLGTGSAADIRDPAALLREAGALLRGMTEGLTLTMLARAGFKSELKLGVTTIRRAENNPFKFSVGADEALERLLLRPNPAFLPALDAARQAFDDIQAHEMAMIAGLRAALRALLARFEPSALEGRLEGHSGLDKLLPMARKSRYWDVFTQIYGQVAADAAEDFMQLFGEAFTRAYEDQTLRLAEARRQARGPGRGARD